MADAATASSPAGSIRLPAVFRAAGPATGSLIALILLSIYNAFFTTNFLTWATLRVNLTQVATIVLVGVGMTLVIATGGIDLSVGALMAIAGCLAPLIFMSHWGPLDNPWVGITLAIIIPILVAGVFGLFNGVLVTQFNIQPIVATLVLFLGGRGIAGALLHGKLREFNNPNFEFIGQGRVFGIPVQVFMMVVVVAVAAWAMRSTTFGRYVLATGGNEAAARLAGVPINKVKLAVYGITGLLSGLAGLIVIALNSSADPINVGLNMELDAIAAAAVGGTILTGGRATIIGTFIGAALIHQIRYTLLSHNVADGTTRMVTAAAIIIAVLIQKRPSS
ncbi:MAG: ABC transporter permease [Rhizobiales bacterium]|nr:ABC transporter permease [Hyphomicrobiales bacterium]